MEINKLFVLFLIIEEENELLRERICKSPHFVSRELFNFIDKDQKTFITLKDLINCLQGFGFSFDEQEKNKMKIIFQEFDEDEDNAWNLQEFNNTLLPLTNNYLRELAINNDYNENFDPYNALKNYSDVIRRMIKQKNLEFQNFLDFKKYIDDIEGFSLKTFSEFMTKTGDFLNKNEIKLLFLRLDKDRDNKISSKDLEKVFFLKQETKKPISLTEKLIKSARKLFIDLVSRSKSCEKLKKIDFFDSENKDKIIPKNKKNKNMSKSMVNFKNESVSKLEFKQGILHWKRKNPFSKIKLKKNLSSDKGSNISIYLFELYNTSIEIEKIQEQLNFQNDFNLIDYFNFYDRQNKGFITQNDLKEGLQCLGLDIKTENICLIMSRFDWKEYGKITYVTFEEIIGGGELENNEKTFIRKGINYWKDFNFDIFQIFSNQTICLIRKLMLKLFEREEKLEKIRNETLKKEDFMEIENSQNVNLEKYGIGPEEIIIFKKIIDFDRDGIISLEEFKYEFQPKLK